MRSTCLGLLLLLFATAPARGTIVTVNYLSPGDGLITRDLDNGLDWLDWTYTNGLSYNQIAPRLLPGGDLEGWRLATSAESIALLESAGVPDEYIDHQYYPSPLVGIDLTNMDGLAAALGKTGIEAGSGNFTASLTDSGTPSFYLYFEINLGRSNVYGTHVTGSGIGGDDNSSLNAGFALVRNAPLASMIPEPATITIWTVWVMATVAAGWRERKGA